MAEYKDMVAPKIEPCFLLSVRPKVEKFTLHPKVTASILGPYKFPEDANFDEQNHYAHRTEIQPIVP